MNIRPDTALYQVLSDLLGPAGRAKSPAAPAPATPAAGPAKKATVAAASTPTAAAPAGPAASASATPTAIKPRGSLINIIA